MKPGGYIAHKDPPHLDPNQPKQPVYLLASNFFRKIHIRYIKMKYSLVAIALAAEAVTAFPFVAEMPGVDSSLFRNRPRQQSGGSNPGGAATCPFNANHVPAPGITAQYPYNGAKNGSQGMGKGGYQVPAPGDTAHQFVAPGPNDIRGPCPGLNAAAVSPIMYP